MDIVGLGALNLDIIYQVKFDHLSIIKKGTERKIEPEELSSVMALLEKKGKFVAKSGGGSAANTIYALSKMGFACGFIGKVGEDKEGDFLLQDLKKVGVDISRIKKEGKTGVCFILIDERGERSILVFPGTNDKLLSSHVDIDYINRAKILHTASFIGDVSFQTQKESILKTEIPISFDPGEPHASKGWEQLLPILRKTWVLFSTGREIELITRQNFKEGSRNILREGVKVVICKFGDKGSWIISKYEEIYIPAKKAKSLDTTGAGDVYAAGFLAGILNNLTFFECGKFATEAAGMSVTGFGRSNYPERKFFEEFLNKARGGNGL